MGAPSGLETAQVDAFTEALREISGRKHRLDHLKELEPYAFCLRQISCQKVVVELHHRLGRNPAACNLSAIRSHQESGKQNFFSANETGKIRPLRLDLVERIHEPGHIPAAVLYANNPRRMLRF